MEIEMGNIGFNHLVLTIYLFLFNVNLCFPYPFYRDLIPNGRIIVNPCDSAEFWEGVGHRSKYGGGPLNYFGLDFLRYGRVCLVILYLKKKLNYCRFHSVQELSRLAKFNGVGNLWSPLLRRDNAP